MKWQALCFVPWCSTSYKPPPVLWVKVLTTPLLEATIPEDLRVILKGRKKFRRAEISLSCTDLELKNTKAVMICSRTLALPFLYRSWSADKFHRIRSDDLVMSGFYRLHLMSLNNTNCVRGGWDLPTDSLHLQNISAEREPSENVTRGRTWCSQIRAYQMIFTWR